MRLSSRVPVGRSADLTSLATLALLLCVVFLSGCQPDSATRLELAADATDLEFCCDPDGEFPFKVGDFRVQIYQGQFQDLKPETIVVTFLSEIDNLSPALPSGHTPSAPVVLSIDSGAVLPFGSSLCEVSVTSCDFLKARVRFLAEVVGRRVDNDALVVRRIDDNFEITNTCPPDAIPSQPQVLVEAIIGADVEDFAQYSFQAPTGVPVLNPDSSVDPQVPTSDYTEVFEWGYLVVDLDQQQLDDAFVGAQPRFPSSTGGTVGDLGFTISSARPGVMGPGRYLLAWQSTVGDIPVEPPFDMRYGLAVDRDSDPANNTMAMSPNDFDQFDDTDTQITAGHQAGRWVFTVLDVQGDRPQALASGARTILFEQVQMLVLPLAELGDPQSFPGRFATFEHRGDFGINQPWSADTTPPVTEDRIAFDLTTDV